MKISHKVLKKYIPNIASPEEVAQDLIMHCAEVEEVHYIGDNLTKVFVGEIIKCEKHPDSEKLNCTQVQVGGEIFPIVCGAPNVATGQKVAVALEGAQLTPDFIIKKTKIRGEESRGMICSEDELGLTDIRQEGILVLPEDAPNGTCVRDYFSLNDAILEVDNKAINHRPDLFSHIGIAREIAAISGSKLNYSFAQRDFSQLKSLEIENHIPHFVSRYTGLEILGVENIASPEYIKDVLNSAGVASKGILIDITNYSLYLYGQPTHCFDADKIVGNIHVRMATKDETFSALDEKEYILSQDDIVIADDSGIIALGGIIGGKNSSVSQTTKNIIVESAHFDQAVIRKTGKRLGLRTDALNVFEKDIVNGMQPAGTSLILQELEKQFPQLKAKKYSDLYTEPKVPTLIPFDLEYVNNLIGTEYQEDQVVDILANLSIILDNNMLVIPFWRKDINNKSDIAEEIARITGYDNIPATVPRINLGAVIQNNTYKLKKETRNFFCSRGFFDMYNYSFVNAELMGRCGGDTKNLVPMKNALSEDMTHLRGSLIPNLLSSLEKNRKDFSDPKLFEFEKVFALKENNIYETYKIAGLVPQKSDIVYYDIQKYISDFFHSIGVFNVSFMATQQSSDFAHKTRTADIILRGQSIGRIGEIHPKIVSNFDLSGRIGFFEINAELLAPVIGTKVKANDLSEFQENNFDLNFVVEKTTPAKDIHTTIAKTNPGLITKVELIDIYENQETLSGKRSLTYKVFIQSMDKTLDDKVKGDLIQEILKRVEKKGGTLR